MSHTDNQITILGGGLVGSLSSILLARQGYQVNIYERRPDMRTSAGYAGRSINLALSDRGFRGLEKAGIAEEIKAISIPMHGRFLHNKDGSSGYQAYGKEGQAIYSVSRAGINMRLMDLAEKEPNVCFHFEQKCTEIDVKTGTCQFESGKDQSRMQVKSATVISGDGAFSIGRLSMQLQTEKFDYQQFYINCGYKELTIPAKAGEGDLRFAMEKNALHIWPRGEFMMIALPNPDGSFTCTLFMPFDGKNGFENLKTHKEVKTFFEREFSDTIALIPDLETDFFKNPTSSLVTVKCLPWHVADKLLLMGDAAHAIVPFYGQGMNCGFEDCIVFDDLVKQYKGDWQSTYQAFEKLRKPNADAIAELAINNFIEMRDLVAQPRFQLQKKIETHFAKLHPEKWIPLYSMVTFSPEIPYSVALAEGKKQQAIMDKILAMADIENKWDTKEVEEMILSLIN
jgi:kynurenine 3-monooxygenase